MNTDSSFRLIDAHVHAPPDSLSASGAAAWLDIEASMAQAGPRQSVVVQFEREMSSTLNTVSWAEGMASVCAVAGWVDVTAPDIDASLDRVAWSAKFKSIALPVFLEVDNHWLVTPDVFRGLKAVAERGLAVDVRVEPRQLPSVGALAAAIPGLRIVVAHLGSPFIARSEREPWGVYMLNVASHANVYIKLSGLPALDSIPWNVAHHRLYVESIVRRFGYERLMFGSDWPLGLELSTYQQVWDGALESAGPTTDLQRQQLTSLTARSFYGLS